MTPPWYLLLLEAAGAAGAVQLLSDCLFLQGQGRCEEVFEEGYSLPGALLIFALNFGAECWMNLDMMP